MNTERDCLKFDRILLNAGSIDIRIGGAMDLALQFMTRADPAGLIDRYFGTAKSSTLGIVKHSIICVDHTGFVTPAQTNPNVLNAIADRHGFTENHTTFPSMIVASELTALNAGVRVPTQIFRGSTKNTHKGEHSFFGIEMFVPDTTPDAADRWIAKGIGTHVAFRVRERSDVDLLRVNLLDAGFHTPAFMAAKSMANVNDGTLTVYFDLQFHDGVFRIEFFHRADA